MDTKCNPTFLHATSCMVRPGNKWPTPAKLDYLTPNVARYPLRGQYTYRDLVHASSHI